MLYFRVNSETFSAGLGKLNPLSYDNLLCICYKMFSKAYLSIKDPLAARHIIIIINRLCGETQTREGWAYIVKRHWKTRCLVVL